MRVLLADSGPLYAIAINTDQHHRRAMEELSGLIETRTTVVAAYPTLFETHKLVLRRVPLPVAQSWLAQVPQLVQTVVPTRADCDQAFLMLQRFSDQPITLFDALLAVLSERLSIPVWTYDHHFDVMQVPVWR